MRNKVLKIAFFTTVLGLVVYIVHNHYEEEKEKNTKKGESKETIEIPELSDVINRVDIPTPRENINKLDEEIARIEKERAEAEKREQERLAKLEEERKKRQAEKQKKKEIVASRGEKVGDAIVFEASYYTPYCDGCSGITAEGFDVRDSIYVDGLRVIATDRSVIPSGSIVKVETPYETFIAIAGDVGGAIKGYKIDILVADRETAYKLGRHKAYVTVLRSGY